MAGTDLAQYNGTPSFPARTDVGTNADPLLTVTDGPIVTADSNAAAQAPVNISIKRFKDLLLGLRAAIIGDFAGAVQKSLRALVIDAQGGNTVTPPAGSMQVTGATGSGTSAPTTSYASGVMFRDSVCLGWARGYWDGAAMVLDRGWNCRSLARNAMGDYTIVFQPGLTDPVTSFVEVTMGINPSVVDHGFVGNVLDIADDGSGRAAVNIVTIDPNAGVKLDATAISPFFVSLNGY